MVPTGEILGDTSVVDNACDLAHIHSVRSIRSENIDGEFCAGLDGKPSDMNCSVMASKVGALAVGAKADNTSEANGLIPPDKFCDNPSCLAHSFLPKPSTEDGAESKFLFFNIPVSAAEHSIITELVVPKIDAESKAIALGQTMASKIDVDKIFSVHAPEPRDADFATRWKNIIDQVRLRVVHHIIEVGTRFTKLLSDARLSLNSFTSPSIDDAFMLSAIGTASVNNDWDSRKFKIQPFSGNPSDFERFRSDALGFLGSAFGNHAEEEHSLGDEAEGKAPYGYVEQDANNNAYFYIGMTAPLPLPGVAPPAGGHPAGTPPNTQRALLLKLATRRKKALSAFLTQHITDQTLKTLLQNQAPSDGGRQWQLLQQHCFRPVNDLTVHELKESIASLGFDSVEIGRTADSLNKLVRVLDNLNFKLPEASRLSESELVEKALRCISSLGNTPLAHSAREELAADAHYHPHRQQRRRPRNTQWWSHFSQPAL